MFSNIHKQITEIILGLMRGVIRRPMSMSATCQGLSGSATTIATSLKLGYLSMILCRKSPVSAW